MDSHAVRSDRGSAAAALVLGICLIVSAAIWSLMFYRARALDNALTVTGSVRQRVTADTVKWTSSFSRQTTMDGLAAASSQMKADLAAVLAFFQSHGIAEKDLTILPLAIDGFLVVFPGSLPQHLAHVLDECHRLSSLAAAGLQAERAGIRFNPQVGGCHVLVERA